MPAYVLHKFITFDLNTDEKGILSYEKKVRNKYFKSLNLIEDLNFIAF